MHTITKKQQDNLLEAARLIEANPRHFDMDKWLCGTSACIYGWATMAHLNRKSVKWANKWFETHSFSDAADDAIGFDDMDLYMDRHWHECEAKEDYFNASDTDYKTKAKAAADYVRWFVANHTEVK